MQKLTIKMPHGEEQEVLVEALENHKDVYRVVDEYGNPHISMVEVENIEYGTTVINSCMYSDCYWVRDGRVIPVMLMDGEQSTNRLVELREVSSSGE